jgi:hypothetical protein
MDAKVAPPTHHTRALAQWRGEGSNDVAAGVDSVNDVVIATSQSRAQTDPGSNEMEWGGDAVPAPLREFPHVITVENSCAICVPAL